MSLVLIYFNRIHNYLVHDVGIKTDEGKKRETFISGVKFFKVLLLNRKYETKYGLTLRGLQKEYSVDPLDFGN